MRQNILVRESLKSRSLRSPFSFFVRHTVVLSLGQGRASARLSFEFEGLIRCWEGAKALLQPARKLLQSEDPAGGAEAGITSQGPSVEIP